MFRTAGDAQPVARRDSRPQVLQVFQLSPSRPCRSTDRPMPTFRSRLGSLSPVPMPLPSPPIAGSLERHAGPALQSHCEQRRRSGGQKNRPRATRAASAASRREAAVCGWGGLLTGTHTFAPPRLSKPHYLNCAPACYRTACVRTCAIAWRGRDPQAFRIRAYARARPDGSEIALGAIGIVQGRRVGDGLLTRWASG